MRNPLQEQLLKAGLVKKDKAAQIVREQATLRRAKVAPGADRVDAQQLHNARAERDRALAAEHNAQRRASEQHAQARQIIASHQITSAGEIPYRFTDGGKIKDLLVSAAQRAQLAAGTLVIARHDATWALLLRSAAEMVYARDPALVVLDHARPEDQHENASDDAYYAQFSVPDDLTW
ncbi:MAG: DUF2058 domain-containing protein [Rhodanobacter sp.]